MIENYGYWIVLAGTLLEGESVLLLAGYAAYSGLLEGNPQQLVNQLIAVGATVGYAVVGTFVIIKLVDVLLGIRVNKEAEEMGLDLSVHGEVAYQV